MRIQNFLGSLVYAHFWAEDKVGRKGRGGKKAIDVFLLTSNLISDIVYDGFPQIRNFISHFYLKRRKRA